MTALLPSEPTTSLFRHPRPSSFASNGCQDHDMVLEAGIEWWLRL